eukprot:4709854-Amphidinium_carterae.1
MQTSAMGPQRFQLETEDGGEAATWWDFSGEVAVALAKLTPGVPAPLTNYGFGVTDVRLRDFAIGSVASVLWPLCCVANSVGTLTMDSVNLVEAGAQQSVSKGQSFRFHLSPSLVISVWLLVGDVESWRVGAV